MTSIKNYIDMPNTLLAKAYHDIKNPLANLILLTEISDASATDSLMPVIKTVNDELWKVVAKLEMLQLLTQTFAVNETTQNDIRIDDVIDEAIENFRKTDQNFHISVTLSDTIEASQLLIAADSSSLSRLLSFILRHLHVSNSTTHWQIQVSYATKGLKITFSKNNDAISLDACEWLNTFDANWEWLAAQKIAKQHNLELSVAYSNNHIDAVMLTQAV